MHAPTPYLYLFPVLPSLHRRAYPSSIRLLLNSAKRGNMGKMGSSMGHKPEWQDLSREKMEKALLPLPRSVRHVALGMVLYA